jgi:hypothetical protein
MQQPGLSGSARFCATLCLQIILSNPLFARLQMLGHLTFTKLAFAKATDARGSLPFCRPFCHFSSPLTSYLSANAMNSRFSRDNALTYIYYTTYAIFGALHKVKLREFGEYDSRGDFLKQ